MFNNLIGKNKELGRFLFCERYTLPPVKNAMYIAEGQELKRGAVVDVNGVLVGINSLMPYAVLEFDCDTRLGGKEASVFIKGEFNFDKLTFASGLSKSDLDNIVYNGSGIGIVIKPYEYAEGFSPLMVQQSTNIAPEFSEDAYYDSNTLVMHNDKLYYNYKMLGADPWNESDWIETSVGDFLYRMKDPTALETHTINSALSRNTRITTLSSSFSFNLVTGECICNCSFGLSGTQNLSKNNSDFIHDYDDNYGLVAELNINPNFYSIPIVGEAVGSILAVDRNGTNPVPCKFIVHGSNTIGIIAAKTPFSYLNSGIYVCTTSVIKPM